MAELIWPVTYTYQMSVPWGAASLRLTVDYPDAANDLERTQASIIPLWKAAVAPATSFLTVFFQGDAYCWKWGVGVAAAGEFPPGENGIHPAGKARGLPLVMHTGHTDKAGQRRLIIPAVPSDWFDELGQLNDDGAGKALTYARGLYGGLNGSIENTPFAWMLAYPDAITDPLTGFKAPGFRYVEYLRVCQYSVPVPDYEFGT